MLPFLVHDIGSKVFLYEREIEEFYRVLRKMLYRCCYVFFIFVEDLFLHVNVLNTFLPITLEQIIQTVKGQDSYGSRKMEKIIFPTKGLSG